MLFIVFVFSFFKYVEVFFPFKKSNFFQSPCMNYGKKINVSAFSIENTHLKIKVKHETSKT